MAVRYDFKIDSNLWSAMKKNAEALKSLSPQRLYIEGTVLSKYERAESMLQKLGISLEKLKEGISHG